MFSPHDIACRPTSRVLSYTSQVVAFVIVASRNIFQRIDINVEDGTINCDVELSDLARGNVNPEEIGVMAV